MEPIKSEIDFAKRRFLIVDDFDGFRTHLRNMTASLGVKAVDLAKDGKEAIKLVEENQYDIILLDFNLGHGKNGQQLLEEIRHRKLIKSHALIAMITGEMDKDMVLTTLEHQPDLYLAKPISLVLLKNRLERASKQKSAMAPIEEAINMGLIDEAIENCDELIQKRSRYAKECIRIKANLLKELDRYDEALAIYESALQQHRSDWALLGKGKVLIETNKMNDAIAVLNELIKSNPLNLEAYDVLAQAHLAKGDIPEAQLSLEKAVNIAPKSLLRQKFFADVCQENEEYEKAEVAYLKTIRLARNSIHFGADNTLNLAKCFVKHASVEEEATGKSLANKALETLEMTRKEFKDSNVETAASLIEARVHRQMGNTEKATSALIRATGGKEANVKTMTPNMALEFADTHIELEEDEKAQKILSQLADQYSDDEKICDKIDKRLDNPITGFGVEKAKEFTSKGIERYKQQDFLGAIDEFKIALKHFPRHIGLKLNIIQAYISVLPDFPEFAEDCEKHVNSLKKLSQGSEQYKRYQNLIQKFKEAQKGKS